MSPFAPVRVHHGLLETPRVSLQHPNGHKVQVIGVVHYARPAVWRYIGKQLASLATRGWAIHYELIQKSPQLSLREQYIATSFRKFRELLHKKFEANGVEYQLQGLRYPRGAVNTDITAKEVYASYKGSLLRLRAVSTLACFVLGLIPDSIFVKVIGESLAKSATDGPDIFFDSRVILDQRNQVAVDHCLAAAPQHVVMVWGAAHVDGIVTLLVHRGYHIVHSQWTPMMRIET